MAIQQGTFYNTQTKERKPFNIGAQPQGFTLEQKLSSPDQIDKYNITFKDKDALYGIPKVQDQALQGQTDLAGTTGTAPAFKLDDLISSNLLSSANSLKSFNDLISNTKTARVYSQDYTTALSDLNNLKTQIDQYNIDTQSATYGLEGQGRGIPLGLIRGQQGKLNEQRQLGAQTLATQYNNTLGKATLYEQQRKNDIDSADNAFTQAQALYNIANQYSQQLMNYKQQLTTNSQNTLNTVLDKFSGINPDALTAEQTAQLAKTITSAGLDPQFVFAGMKANYTKGLADKNLSQDQTMMNNGYQYVSTPALRDQLKAEGKKVITLGGRDYVEVKKTIDPPSIAEQISARGAGATIDGKGNLVFKTDTTLSSPSGHSYDMSTYAANAKAHTSAVQSIVNNIGKFNTVQDIDNYIKSRQPNSTITGQMIANAAAKNGIGWEELTALIQHEAILGTSNVSVKNNNPGGITWTQTYQDSHPGVTKGTARPASEGGNYVRFKTMQDGVNAVAGQLARRSGGEVSGNNKFTQEFYATEQGQRVLNNEQQEKTNFMSQQTVKDYAVVLSKAASVEAIVNSGVGGPGDLALVYDFMKALDPTSVVRESEYASAASSGNIFLGALAKFNGYLKEEGGMLPDQVKQSFLSIMKTKLAISKAQFDNVRSQYQQIARESGLNPDHVAPNMSVDFGGAEAGKNQEAKNLINDITANNSQSTPATNTQQSFLSKAWNWLFGD